MPDMKNMKLTKTEGEAKETALSPEREAYPYGLSVNLDEESISKLGLEKLPSPGEKVKLDAIAEVRSASISKDEEGQRRSLYLQITSLSLGGGIQEEEESDTVDGQGQQKRPPEDVIYTG